jgi:hypothetical protein
MRFLLLAAIMRKRVALVIVTNQLRLNFFNCSLEISRDHMLLVRGKYVPASAVQVGDELESASGNVMIVEAINTVVRTGVYAPLTSSGTIIVSNIKASNGPPHCR